MPNRDPDWWTGHTDDYAATYDDDDEKDRDVREGADVPTSENYAEFDTGVRFSLERGRPGYAHPDDD